MCGRRKTACSPVLDPFVRLQKPLLNDDYAARRSICAFSAVVWIWAVRADCVVLRQFDECDSQRRLCGPHGASAAPGGGVCRPPGRTSESRCSSNTAQTPTMLCRGHMLMILARLVRSESFWAVVKVRSPHTGPEFGYPRRAPQPHLPAHDDHLRGLAKATLQHRNCCLLAFGEASGRRYTPSSVKPCAPRYCPRARGVREHTRAHQGRSIEAVLPGGEAIFASGHAMEAHA